MDNKIKILFFQWKLVLGGTETSLFDLLRMMNKDKFDITLFVMEEGGVWDKKFQDAGIRIIGPYSYLNSKKSVISESEYNKRKKRIDKSINNFCIGLLDICTDEKWDIVVAYHPYIYRLGVFQKKAKTVFYLHMDAENYPFLKNDLLSSPDYYKSFDKIISVSNFAKKSFVKISSISDNVVVHFNPIDRDAIIEKSKESIDFDFPNRYICAVGRLSVQKGYERLIKIHKRLLNEGLNHKLVIVGEGELRKNIEDAVSEVYANDSVILAGFQDNPQPFIKNSILMAVSSFHEGLCMSAMEAIILGVPVVSTIPTLYELSGDEECGIVTDVDDDSLYDGLRKMLSDDAFYKKCKEAAKRRSLYYDGKRMTEEVEKEFIDLFNERTDYRTKRKHVKREIRKAKKSIDRDLRHLPNRVARSILGDRFYDSIKAKLKNGKR